MMKKCEMGKVLSEKMKKVHEEPRNVVWINQKEYRILFVKRDIYHEHGRKIEKMDRWMN